MGCKNCKKVIRVETAAKKKPQYSGKTAYFVTQGGYKDISLEANGKNYVFYEDKPIEAPIEFQKFIFLKIVPKPVGSIDQTSSSVSEKISDTTKKKDK